MLWLTYPPNLMSLPSAVMEIWNALKCTKWGWFAVVRGLPRSSAMSSFDRAHTISYSCLIETMRPSSTVFEIQRVICWNSPTSTYTTCIWRPRWVWLRSNFENFLASENQSPWAINHTPLLRDPICSRFDTISACDRRTDRQTDIHADTRRQLIPR